MEEEEEEGGGQSIINYCSRFKVLRVDISLIKYLPSTWLYCGQ